MIFFWTIAYQSFGEHEEGLSPFANSLPMVWFGLQWQWFDYLHAPDMHGSASFLQGGTQWPGLTKPVGTGPVTGQTGTVRFWFELVPN